MFPSPDRDKHSIWPYDSKAGARVCDLRHRSGLAAGQARG